ncbi:alpha/beta fold hydrolase [Paraburkholderia kururiensis]|uniref:alpha/beta fold hydrolase n=1 Tax=Paraburkholderia kururiensis TaxID=984307 RepID=UPI0005AAD180|nr:alpha/beta hydrolase [Paraburkholderia kururiensis]
MKETLVIDGIDVIVESEENGESAEASSRETIVMIHGWPDTYRLWDRQVEHFKTRYRCVRFTLPGFDIAKPRRAFSLDEIVETIRHIVERTCGDGKAIMMLHDWGCVFGYQFCMRHPERVAKIVGIDVGDAASRQYLNSLSVKSKAMIVGYQVWLAIAWRIGGGIGGKIGDRMTKYMARLLRVPSDADFIGSHMDYPYFIQWTGAHGSFRNMMKLAPACPMLFVYGTRKPFMFHSPQWAEALAAQPGSKVCAIRAGHWVMVDNAQAFNQTVSEWLAAG